MVYLKSFKLLSEELESGCVPIRKIYNNYYPLGIFPEKKLSDIYFEPVTIFYGGNGSGKTTLLNIIAKKLEASRKNIDLLGDVFDNYVNMAQLDINKRDLKEIKIILSDDVFDYLIDIRTINSKINRRKEDLAEEYLNNKFRESTNNIDLFNEHEHLKDVVESRKKTQSAYIRERLRNNNIIQESNGETALAYWQNEIQDHAIYLIDEPENSLSAENQIKLKQFIEDSARFYDCQFIIATHSPFLLSIADAKIYDLDSVPAGVKKWTELENVRIYHDFFREHENEFD